MLKMPNLLLLLVFIASGTAIPGFADPEAVDVADSMDFERFHATDVWSIGIGQTTSDPKGEQSESNATEQPTPLHRVADSSNSTQRAAQQSNRQRRISNPYGFSPDRSVQSATDATEGMFRNMAKQCPQGWQKDREWSTPTADGFLLHFEFHCLNHPS